jgi:hypothetical protein
VLFWFLSFVLGSFCWVFVRVFRVNFDLSVYTSFVRRGALRFLFYKIYLLIKKKKTRECCCLEDSDFVPFVVSMEEKE